MGVLAAEPCHLSEAERPELAEIGRSDWGLFACRRREEVDSGQHGRSQIYTYALDRPLKGCEGGVDVLKPISGLGAEGLMHGNFARRVSPSLEALSWRVATRRKNFKGAKVLELGAGLGLTGLATAVWTMRPWLSSPMAIQRLSTRCNAASSSTMIGSETQWCVHDCCIGIPRTH